MAIIYQAINKANNKSYIGQTISSLDKRKAEHLSSAKTKQDAQYFHKAIRKYGVDSFKWEIICECPEQDLNAQEIYWIKYYKTCGINGYNTSEGGNSQSAQTRIKISNTLKGKYIKLNGNCADHTIYTFYHNDYSVVKCKRIELQELYNISKSTISHLFGKHKRTQSNGWKIINNN